MKLRPKETFEQQFKAPTQRSGFFGSVDSIKFKKGQVYQFFILPVVTSIDLENDDAEIDYPFKLAVTHFNTWDFMQKYTSTRGVRINCTGNCAIDQWMAEQRLPASVYRIAVGTEFYVAYTIHDRKIKTAWFQDYLYTTYKDKLGTLMNEKNINLINALSYRVKVFTNEEGKLDIAIEDVVLPSDKIGHILKAIHDKPLVDLIENLSTDRQTIDSVLHALKDYNEDVIRTEKTEADRVKMEEKSALLSAMVDGFKSDYKPGGNKPVTDEDLVGVGPLAETPAEEDPF